MKPVGPILGAIVGATVALLAFLMLVHALVRWGMP